MLVMGCEAIVDRYCKDYSYSHLSDVKYLQAKFFYLETLELSMIFFNNAFLQFPHTSCQFLKVCQLRSIVSGCFLIPQKGSFVE